MNHFSEPSVLYVSPVAEMGGAEQVMLAYARLLPQQGFRTAIAMMRPGPLVDIAKSQGIKVHVFQKNYRYRDTISVLQSIHWLRNITKDNKYNILHVNHTGHLQTWPSLRGIKSKEVWHIHDFPHEKGLIETINTKMHPDFMLFTTHKNKSGYPQLNHIPSEVVHPCCVDVLSLQSIPADPLVRQRLGIGERPFFLSVTRLQPHKGHHYLIEAAKEVVALYPDICWAIVGKASGTEQEQYLSLLQEEIKKHKLEEHVRFLGFVSDLDLAALRREAIALVHSATSEGFGLVLIEAMAVGTPVIAAAADGPQEIIQDGKNGILVPKADSSALAKAMLRLLEEPELRPFLSAQSLHYVQNHNLNAMLDETIQIYRTLLSQ